MTSKFTKNSKAKLFPLLLKKFFVKVPKPMTTQCLKITEKVAYNIASEASYVYILSGQKFIKNAKMVKFGELLKT